MTLQQAKVTRQRTKPNCLGFYTVPYIYYTIFKEAVQNIFISNIQWEIQFYSLE